MTSSPRVGDRAGRRPGFDADAAGHRPAAKKRKKKAKPITITVLSSRADLVSGGSALLRIGGVKTAHGLKVTVGRKSYSKRFAKGTDGYVEGLVRLGVGRAKVLVARPQARGDDHPDRPSQRRPGLHRPADPAVDLPGRREGQAVQRHAGRDLQVPAGRGPARRPERRGQLGRLATADLRSRRTRRRTPRSPRRRRTRARPCRSSSASAPATPTATSTRSPSSTSPARRGPRSSPRASSTASSCSCTAPAATPPTTPARRPTCSTRSCSRTATRSPRTRSTTPATTATSSPRPSRC